MTQRILASATRSKNAARRAPHESRVGAGIAGAHRRAAAGTRHLVPMAIAALLAVPLWAAAGEGDREDDKDRAGKSFNDLSRKDVAHSWRGEHSSGEHWGWKFESDDDDEKDEKSRRWPHEGNGHASAIPEPATAALLLGGLAAVGFVVVRRRRTD